MAPEHRREPQNVVAARWQPLNLNDVFAMVDSFGGRACPGMPIAWRAGPPAGENRIYFNARYYDPTLGRFITEDPSRKGTGWYTYCSNNPINRTDPTGRYDPDDPDRGRWAASPSSYQSVIQEDASLPSVPTVSRDVAGGGADLVPTTVLRGEELLGRAYGHYGVGYTEYIPADAQMIDCTQFTAYASRKPVVGSGEYETSRHYTKVEAPLPGDTVVWRATAPSGAREGHGALFTGEEGNRELLHSYGPSGKVEYTVFDVVENAFQASGYTNITIRLSI